MRDVLYGAISRRKRRTLHRAYADLLEKRHQGRLDRVYPELVHHFSEGDVPEKAVDYSLKLAKKSLDAFSPEEAARVAKTALDYLGDEEWEGEKALEGDARLLLAQASRMSGHADAALREAEAAGKIFEREKQPARAVEAILFAADTAWNSRKVDEARRLVERGIEAAASAQDTVHLPEAALARGDGREPARRLRACRGLRRTARTARRRREAGSGGHRFRRPARRRADEPDRRDRARDAAHRGGDGDPLPRSSRRSSRPTPTAGSCRRCARSGPSATRDGRPCCGSGTESFSPTAHL